MTFQIKISKKNNGAMLICIIKMADYTYLLIRLFILLV